MLEMAVVREIRDLLATGELSQRKIARRIGVSRGTVNAIAQGKRPDDGARHGGSADELFRPQGLPERCPGCGGMVLMPCLACHVRTIRDRRTAHSLGPR